MRETSVKERGRYGHVEKEKCSDEGAKGKCVKKRKDVPQGGKEARREI